jgi:ParB family chromosome partitioning protein
MSNESQRQSPVTSLPVYEIHSPRDNRRENFDVDGPNDSKRPALVTALPVSEIHGPRHNPRGNFDLDGLNDSKRPALVASLPVSEIHGQRHSPHENFDADGLNDAKRPAPVTSLPVSEIHGPRHNPRENFDSHGLKELADSILAHGVLQPILVRKDGAGYRLVVGERRWRAAKMAGLTLIPATVRPDVSDVQALQLAMVENLEREDLNPIEEAEGYRALSEIGSMSQRDIASAVKRSQASVCKMLQLLELPESVREMIRSGNLPLRHGLELLKYAGFPDALIAIAETAVEHRLTVSNVAAALSTWGPAGIIGAGLIQRGLAVQIAYRADPCHRKVCPLKARFGNLCLNPTAHAERVRAAGGEFTRRDQLTPSQDDGEAMHEATESLGTLHEAIDELSEPDHASKDDAAMRQRGTSREAIEAPSQLDHSPKDAAAMRQLGTSHEAIEAPSESDPSINHDAVTRQIGAWHEATEAPSQPNHSIKHDAVTRQIGPWHEATEAPSHPARYMTDDAVMRQLGTSQKAIERTSDYDHPTKDHSVTRQLGTSHEAIEVPFEPDHSINDDAMIRQSAALHEPIDEPYELDPSAKDEAVMRQLARAIRAVEADFHRGMVILASLALRWCKSGGRFTTEGEFSADQSVPCSTWNDEDSISYLDALGVDELISLAVENACHEELQNSIPEGSPHPIMTTYCIDGLSRPI